MPYRGFGEVTIHKADGGSSLQLPDDRALLRGLAEIVAEIPADRAPTFFEASLRNRLKPSADKLGESGLPHAEGDLSRAIETIRFLLARRAGGRFQPYTLRREISGSELPAHVIAMSQGVPAAMHWRGIPLLKSIFDLNLYMMLLWDLKPQTIIETGSASGGSAAWFADMMETYGLECHIYSLDLHRPGLLHPKITFMQGDCRMIDQSLPRDLLENLPHPWLFTEDAHVNVAGVLEWIHGFARAGDYLVIEDTTNGAKEAAVAQFAAAHGQQYKVDTYYTDFFGYNACSSRDSIFRRF